jgi:hypothetical protein
LSSELDYGLLSINAGLIGSIFIFFSISLLASNFSVFAHNQDSCSYGFSLSSEDSQIAIIIGVGFLLIPFALSSMLVLLKQKGANILTATGFGFIVVAALIILSSLSCRIPTDFFVAIMIIPAAASVVITLFLFATKRFSFTYHKYSVSGLAQEQTKALN